jgi:hypothetical protein
MLFAHETLKRDLRNARRILWWSFTLELLSASLAGLGLSYGVYALLVLGFSVTLLLAYYLLFLGFSRLAKHFHVMPLFWVFVAQMMFSVFFAVFDVIEKLSFYGMEDPYLKMASSVALITGAVLTFMYGVYIMRFPYKKFGGILLRIRMVNIAKAFLMVALVYIGATDGGEYGKSALFGIVSLGTLTMIVVCNIYDFVLLGKSLRLLGGVLPHPAPRPS